MLFLETDTTSQSLQLVYQHLTLQIGFIVFSTEPKTTENKPAGSKKLFCFKQHTPVQNKTLSDKDLQTQTFSQKNKEVLCVKYYVAAAITIKPI